MVNGKLQPAKSGSSKKVSAVSKQQPLASPATLVKKPSCTTCGTVVTDEVKALQCDRCQAVDKWRCAECLNLPPEMYDHLVSDPACSLRWLCPGCDKAVLETGNMNIQDSADKLDCWVNLVEKLLDKLTAVEDKLRSKCDIGIVSQLDSRLKNLEDYAAKQDHDMSNKITLLESKLDRHVKSNEKEVTEQLDSGSNLQKRVQHKVIKQMTEDKDLENRKKNVIIYRVPEVPADNADDRMNGDTVFLTELLESVFHIKPEDQGIDKMFRLGQYDASNSTPRPF